MGGDARVEASMSYWRSRLRRTGALLCACAIACGALAGCRTATATPSATPAPTTYKNAGVLARNLASLGQVSGPVSGTIQTGSDTEKLSGTVSLNGHDSEVQITEAGSARQLSDEIVVAGHRYTSPDNVIWIDRGAEPKGSSLAEALAGAATTVDDGASTVGGVAAHEIVTPVDVVDMATALGIDPWTFDHPSSVLRIWADASGKPLGFGATMSWQVNLGGTEQDVAIDLDVPFIYTSPVEIAAPAKPWQWIDDQTSGLALAVPSDWQRTTVNDAQGVTSYFGDNYTVGYTNVGNVGQASLSDETTQVVKASVDQPSSPRTIVVGAENASLMTIHRSKQNDYVVLVVILHETLLYEILVIGSPDDSSGTDSLAAQVAATVEFTR